MTDHTHGSFDEGYVYLDEVVRSLTLTYASEEFKETYRDTIDLLREHTGFKIEQKND